MAALRILWLLLACACRFGAAVDASKFRTCEQGAFCRRYRKFVKRVATSGEFAHALQESSLEVKGHVATARLRHLHDKGVRDLRLSLKFFREGPEGPCGLARLHVTEEDPLHPRFQLQEGDVVTKEELLSPDVLELSKPGKSWARLQSKAPGGCAVALRFEPFELSFEKDGRVLQRLNARHLLSFESYRKQGTKHEGLVDATDVDDGELWQEAFGGHTDTKPRGPAAVGFDVDFEGAEDIVGMAEHAAGLNLAENGFEEPYRFFNLDVFEYAIDVPTALYGAVPFATAVHRWDNGSAVSGFFAANPSESFVKVEKAEQGVRSWWLFESGVLDAWFFAGPTPHCVMRQYHIATGMPRFPPVAALGKHQSRWNYVDIEDSLNVNKKFDQHDIPYDVLWLDIDHTDGKKYFTWHPTHFDKPDRLLDGLAASKRKLVTIVDPHIKREESYKVYKELKAGDFFTRTHKGSEYDGWCWPGTSSYPDFCNPAMREKWATFFSMSFYPHNRPDLYTWNDMNEPSVFNGPEVTMPRDNFHACHTGSYGVEHRDVHNVYGFYHHMATVQGQLARAPNVRPFVLTRSFFAGSHRHGAVWTGDNMARWNHLARSVPMLLSLCLSGISFAGADVPGFFYDAEPELFRRWHQLGIWYPFYRGHAHLETKRREPWLFGDEVTAMVRRQVSVRYQLLPMWYTLFAEHALAAWPILRPLWYHNLDEPEAFRHSADHFLVGEALLVRSVPEKEMKKAEIYLPKGAWYDFWSAASAPFEGGKVATFELDADHVPVLVREGSILFKKLRRRRSAGAMDADPYSIFVFGASAKGRIYVDDGSSHDYQSGSFLYDEFEFEGGTLRPRPLAPFKNGLEAKGLPEAFKHKLRVERVVFLGLRQEPLSAKLVREEGSMEELPLSGEKVEGGFWSATVKKPSCVLGTQWSLDLALKEVPPEEAKAKDEASW